MKNIASELEQFLSEQGFEKTNSFRGDGGTALHEELLTMHVPADHTQQQVYDTIAEFFKNQGMTVGDEPDSSIEVYKDDKIQYRILVTVPVGVDLPMQLSIFHSSMR